MTNILSTKNFAKFHHPPHLQVTQDIIDRVSTTSLNHNTIIYDFKMENFYLHESRNGFDILQTKKPVPVKDIVLRRRGRIEVCLSLAIYSVFYNPNLHVAQAGNASGRLTDPLIICLMGQHVLHGLTCCSAENHP
jgi:hypothetical protein